MDKPSCKIGMVGLGVMGSNLLLNIAEHGFRAAAFNRTTPVTEAFMAGPAAGMQIKPCYSLDELLGSLEKPRKVMVMVNAGKAVDQVIGQLELLLEQGDLIIDGGNSFFKDTERRAKNLAEKGILHLGVGISGGETGARHGPSMMPGGPRNAYELVRPIFEAISAHTDDEPCVTYLGPTSAGHYVKMVHNGIEYGIMQLIAETYDLLKRGLGLNDDELHVIYDDWNTAETSSFLLEITAKIFSRVDERTGARLVDLIADVAKQKGTGAWTSQDAMELQVPVPTVDIAVEMRNLSAFSEQRSAAARLFNIQPPPFEENRGFFIERLHDAFYAAMIITYAQCMAQLRAASQAYAYDLSLADVARIWRGGCIIRAALLEIIRAAYHANADLPSLLLDPDLGREVMRRHEPLRFVVRTAADLGVPAPAFMVSLAYFDSYRSAHLPTNLIQAQRDYFGAHTYERVDADGVFHTQWDLD